MLSFQFPRRFVPALSLFLLLLAAGCTTSTTTKIPPLQALTYDGDHGAVDALDHELAAAGHDPAALNPIAARLIQMLRDPATTPAARQAICERLRVFSPETLLAGDNRALFLGMFADEKQLNFARLALDLVPGPEVDQLYLDALAASTPTTRLAFVQTIGNRHLSRAVPALAELLKDSDVAVVAASVKALGQIGTADALAALASAPAPTSARVTEARLTAAYQLGGPAGAREFQLIVDSGSAPENLRAAAFRALLFAEPATAANRVITALSGENAILKPVVIQAIAMLPSPDLVPALSTQLSTWDPATQAAVIAALAHKGDAAAVSAISAATRHENPVVRSAAITALGMLPGNSDVAVILARIAAGDNADEAKLARLSLARLTGPEVADTITAGAPRGEQPLRIVFLNQVAARNMSASVPLLLSMREDPAAPVRSAALGALAEIAPPTEQHAILDWAIAATDANEQVRALRALASVTLRNPDVTQRAQLVTDAIEHASPDVALRLLPVLPRIGGTASAESAGRLALGTDSAVSNAAIITLNRWTDLAGLQPLVDVAEKTTSESTRSAAIQGTVRYLERSRELPAADLTAIVSRLVPLCRETEPRTRLVYLLGRSSGTDALALAKKFQSDPAIAAVAADAAMIIEANRAGRLTVRASANEARIKNIIDGKLNTRWSVPAHGTQWIEVDFKMSRPMRQLVLDNNGETWGAPEKYQVFVTNDPKHPGDALATGAGQLGKTKIDLPANTRGRYLIIRQTAESEDSVWAISELIVD